MSIQTKCKYCGQKFAQSTCTKSPNKRHIAIADGIHCVYCGAKFAQASCVHSPSKRHQLDA